MKKLLLAGVAALLSSAAAQADVIFGDRTVGGLTFQNITCIDNAGAGAIGNCGNLSVTAAPAGNGIQITGLIAAVAPPAGANNDVVFQYTLLSTSPLTSIGLVLNSFVTGDGFASVTEQVFTNASQSNLLTTLTASNPGNATDSDTLPGVSSIFVSKDIAVSVLTAGRAEISIVTQTFTTPVPEPATLALLGAGLLGLGVARRARRKDAVSA